MVTAT